jgi:hypothetical protein
MRLAIVMLDILIDKLYVVRFIKIQYNDVWYAYHFDMASAEKQGL